MGRRSENERELTVALRRRAGVGDFMGLMAAYVVPTGFLGRMALGGELGWNRRGGVFCLGFGLAGVLTDKYA